MDNGKSMANGYHEMILQLVYCVYPWNDFEKQLPLLTCSPLTLVHVQNCHVHDQNQNRPWSLHTKYHCLPAVFSSNMRSKKMMIDMIDCGSEVKNMGLLNHWNRIQTGYDGYGPYKMIERMQPKDRYRNRSWECVAVDKMEQPHKNAVVSFKIWQATWVSMKNRFVTQMS